METNPIKILIADDEPVIIEIISFHLNKAGYEVVSAKDGSEAIEKAKQFNFDLKGASLASDAFFPFDDCVKIAHQAGIESFIQPGGSVRDKDSIEYCVKNGLAMVITGLRHFKH